MERRETDYIPIEDAAREAGMTPAWVRKQIREGRLAARVWKVGDRPTYRITRSDWDQFVARYSGPADDVRFASDADPGADHG